MVQRFVRPGMTVYDVGAQAGYYTIIFSRLVEEGHVYAFEPFPENVRYALRHVRLNNLHNVHVVQAALAARTGLAGFTMDRGPTQNAMTDIGDSRLIVPTLSLDDAVALHKLSPPHLVKMDVEGQEAGVLQGSRHTIETHSPVLFISLHGEQQRQSCQAFLEKAGYHIYDLTGRLLTGPFENDEVYATRGGSQPRAEQEGRNA
ncbi:MAG: FkbM family methyltransferase [Chloroflexi bacterium]|nr:FkbM family methyltransferase [Chloroflexota bacterium]